MQAMFGRSTLLQHVSSPQVTAAGTSPQFSRAIPKCYWYCTAESDVEYHANIQPNEAPTTHHATTQFKLTIVTMVFFSERLVIANLSSCLLFIQLIMGPSHLSTFLILNISLRDSCVCSRRHLFRTRMSESRFFDARKDNRTKRDSKHLHVVGGQRRVIGSDLNGGFCLDYLEERVQTRF